MLWSIEVQKKSNMNVDFTKASDQPLKDRESLKSNACEAMTLLQKSGIYTQLPFLYPERGGIEIVILLKMSKV